jgi:hypothetical protein
MIACDISSILLLIGSCLLLEVHRHLDRNVVSEVGGDALAISIGLGRQTKEVCVVETLLGDISSK